MAQDTTGWSQYTDNASEHEYRGDFRISSTEGTMQSKANAIVITNKASGNYNVFRDNGLLEGLGTKAYSYNADTGKEIIESQVEFDKLFTGPNAKQFEQVNKITKRTTIALAKNAVNDNSPQSKASWTNLINKKGYLSFGQNGAETNPNDQNADLRAGSPVARGEGESPNRVQEESFSAGGSTETLRYPRQSLEQFGYDYIQISAYDYEKGGKTGLETGKDKKSGFGSGGRFKKKYETIQLPMQPNLSESTGVSWGKGELNEIEAAAARGAMGTIEGAGAGKVDDILGAGADMIGEFKGMLKDPQAKGAIAAYFAGQAVGQNVLTRATGNVINPNMELLFEGPTMRSFSFNFTLTPRDREEARICRKIIRAMKRNMAPQRSSSNLFLKTPRIFQIEYIYGEGNTPHPFMNKFKPCACQNFNVNYTPDGSYMTYAGEPSMTSYTIGMSFGEIEPIYADEYKGINSPTMGF